MGIVHKRVTQTRVAVTLPVDTVQPVVLFLARMLVAICINLR